MARPADNLVGRTVLNHGAEIHHDRALAEIAHQGEVVTDIDGGQSHALAHLAHQGENARAHADIQHRDRLIGHQEARDQQDAGRGQRVDVALLDGLISTLTYQAMSYFATGTSPKRLGTRHPSIVPYETFETKDGFINIGAANEKQWQNLCKALGYPDLAFDPRQDRKG